MTDDAPQHERPRLVRHARAPVRRRRRHLQLPLSRLGIPSAILAASIAPAVTWTAAMIALALAVRY